MNTLRPSSECELCTPSSVTQSPPLLLVASTTTHLRPVRAQLSCLTSCCAAHDGSRCAPASLFSRQWIPISLQILPLATLIMVPSWVLRLASGSAVEVAVMISDARGLWHADMIRPAAVRCDEPRELLINTRRGCETRKSWDCLEQLEPVVVIRQLVCLCFLWRNCLPTWDPAPSVPESSFHFWRVRTPSSRPQRSDSVHDLS